MGSGDLHAPSFLVYINNSRLPAAREAEIKEIVVIDRINAPSFFKIVTADPEGEWKDKDDFFAGSKVKISLGYKDDMEELFTGDVTGVSCSYRRGESVEVTVTGQNPLHKLKRFKKYRAFTKKKVKDIVSELADSASLSADAENLSYEHPFAVQNETSDFEYLLAIAERYDCFFSVKDTTLSFKRLKKNTSENLVLEYGKTLLEFRPNVETAQVISEVEVHAWNPAKHEAVTGKAKFGDIDSQGGKVVNDALGGGKAAFTDAYAIDQNCADQLAKDMLARNSREYVSGEGATYGNTKILAGAVVKIEGVAKKYAGKYLVVSALHRIVPMKGYKTSFSFVSSLGTPAQSGAGEDSSRKESAQPPAAAAAETKQEQKKNPQFSNLKWVLDGQDVTRAHVGDVVILSADVKDMDDGTSVKITLWEKDKVGTDDFIGSFSSYASAGKVERKWTVEYHEDADDAESEQEQKDKGYTLPEYVFKMETTAGPTAESGESPVLETYGWMKIKILDEKTHEPLANTTVVLHKPDGSTEEIQTDDKGYIEQKDIKMGDYKISVKENSDDSAT